MQRTSFNSGWRYRAGQTAFDDLSGTDNWTSVTIPHDAMRDLARTPTAPSQANTAFYPGGYFQYAKEFDVPADYADRSVAIEFEGVYRDAMIYINGDFAGQRPYGYSRFRIDAYPFLRFGQANTIMVESRAHQDSRWYTGAGIYRDTHLIVGAPTHIAVDGVRIVTPEVDREVAVVEIEVRVANTERRTRTARVSTEIKDPRGETAARATAPVTVLPHSEAVVRFRVAVTSPALWSPANPALYMAETTLAYGGAEIDSDSTSFGIRSLSLDPIRGLRVNGEVVKLRGACVHHDMGVLGASSIRRAEERRIEILKEAGFNAIRSSHNPLSVAALEACDRLGMFVLDEAFDIWAQPKTPFDYSLAFPEWWERDIESMVEKDINHPSVIMYSIGNEIFEVGSDIGSTLTRRLSEKVRSLDSTRFVTNALNGLVATTFDGTGLQIDSADGATDVNKLIMELSEDINRLGASPLVTERTEESHSVVDIAGLNYADSRYLPDRSEFPNRILLGTETFPGRIDILWPLVEESPTVIGDFAWTGWDYLGEVGAGRIDYPDEHYVSSGFLGTFPALTAGLGDIDITGHRNPISFYREMIYGLREQPYIAVHRPQRHGQSVRQSPWAWTDSVSSWSWAVDPGSPVTVDVYSLAEEVELFVGGESAERIAVGGGKRGVARFETTYVPGSLVAVAYSGGVETGREELRSATHDVVLRVSPDRDELRDDHGDLSYVALELRDVHGVLVTDRDRRIEVEVAGSGTLAGLGTGRTSTLETFDATNCTSFNGRALAVIRPSSVGRIDITVRAEGCPSVTTAITVSGE